jgi:hypothetical protein
MSRWTLYYLTSLDSHCARRQRRREVPVPLRPASTVRCLNSIVPVPTARAFSPYSVNVLSIVSAKERTRHWNARRKIAEWTRDLRRRWSSQGSQDSLAVSALTKLVDPLIYVHTVIRPDTGARSSQAAHWRRRRPNLSNFTRVSQKNNSQLHSRVFLSRRSTRQLDVLRRVD